MISDYRADIDGLRGVAIMLVLAFHAFPSALPGGFVGVDVFFVISGYLITGIILADLRESKFSFVHFYTRRGRRLLPALSIVLITVLAIGWILLLPAPYQNLGRHAVASALFFPNVLSWNEVGYFDASAETKPLLHLWSLGVEEQFYWVWPALMVILSKRRAGSAFWLAIIVAVSFAYSCYATWYQPAAAFYSPLSRLWELGAGGMLASVNLRMRGSELLSFAGLGIIAASAALLTKTSPFPGLLAVGPVIGSCLVIVFGSTVLSSKWPVYVGSISYPLYLWHWPLLSFAGLAGQNSIATRGGIIAASFILAALTTVLVERPIRFGSLRRVGVKISVVATLLVLGCSALVWRGDGFPQRFPDEVRSVLETMHYDPGSGARVMKCWLDSASPFERYDQICGVGDTLVWGDSHAARLYAGLRRDDLDIAQFTRDGCAPLLGAGDEMCARSNASIVQAIAASRPRRVILFAAWAVYRANGSWTDQWDRELLDTLKKLKDLVEDVTVIGPAPSWSPDLPTGAYNFWRSNGRFPDRMEPVPLDYHTIDEALASASSAAGAHFVSAFDILCDKNGCLTHAPGSRAELLSWDYGHLTLAGAKFLATYLTFD